MNINMAAKTSTLAKSKTPASQCIGQLKYDAEEVKTCAYENNNYSEKELSYLVNNFTVGAVAALQIGGQREWIHFREILMIVQPVGRVLLQSSQQVQHYLQRVTEHIHDHQEELGGLGIIKILDDVFPDFEYSKKGQRYPPAADTDNSTKKLTPIKKHSGNDGNVLYTLDFDFLESRLQPNLLQVTDISQNLPRVVSEIAKHESVWKNCLGFTLVAANTDIPCQLESSGSEAASMEIHSENLSINSEIYTQTVKTPKTGLDVVESLVQQHVVDTTKIWYLNFSDTVHFRPYDLTVVSKNRVKPEHFVISVFGVLHVKPIGESELITLGHWYREATLFKTIRKVKFFRTYLISKSYLLWKSNVKFMTFCKIRKQVKDGHLLGIPSIKDAIVKINQLLTEMESTLLFPADKQSCYTLDLFNNDGNSFLSKAQKCSEKLHSHCQTIVSKVQSDCLEYLKYCEFQLQQKSDNIKESMTLAKHRTNQQITQLRVARYFMRKVPSFARLVELMLHEFMINFVSKSIAAFVHEITDDKNKARKGFFYASFQFDSITSMLTLSPSAQHLENSLKRIIDDACLDLFACCMPLILPIITSTEPDGRDRDKDDKTVLTTSQLKTLLNCGPKEANSRLHQDTKESLKDQIGGSRGKYRDQDDADYMRKVAETKRLLQDRINENNEVQQCKSVIHSVLMAALAQVEKFKKKHSWISDIHKFVSSWDENVLDSWHGQSASKIEKQVQQIKTWTEQVEHVQHSLTTSNGLLFVDASGIQNFIVPGLEAIFTELMDMTAHHCLLSSENLIFELHRLSEMLSMEASKFEEFATFYVKLKQCKEEATQLQSRVEYTNSIFEVTRHCYRQLTADEEETEEKLHTEWDVFQYALQGANNKFNSLSPQMMENLETALSELDSEAVEITMKVTSGKFLVADEDPKYILPELKKLHERFTEIKNGLLNLAECKEVVAEEPRDLINLESMQARINARHELWKYCEVSTYTIKEWLQTPFCKLQVKKVIEKVSKWKEAAAKLKQDIPVNDEVLEAWLGRIEDFAVDLPFLLELSSVPLKTRHWKWLFAGMGQIFDQSYQYSIADLTYFGLRDHSDLVLSICDGAAAEHALESYLRKLTKKWELAEFKLMKHYQNEEKLAKQDPGNKNHKLQILKGYKKQYQGATSSSVVLIITGVNELQSQVEDNLVTLQTMLVSPHLAENRSKAETWSSHLHQLKEILDLWINCQQKWLYLGKIFFDEKMSRMFTGQQKEFEEIDLKYKEHMAAVMRDPKVLSVLEKKRGDKGFRELQGENLRSMFFELITKEEAIIKSLSSYLEGVRSSFPRLYFLSDNNMLELLACTRNPKHLVPFVKKCFPGIANLKFVLPQTLNNKLRTQLDVALNAHQLEVTSFYGECGEEVTLPEPLVPNPQTEYWLRSIENAMKNVLWNKMGQCIEERMLSTPCIKQLMKGIGMLQGSNEAEFHLPRPTSARRRLSLDETQKAFWYMVYPFQCVVAAEEVIWTSKLTKAVDPQGLETMQDVRSLVESNIEQYSTAIQSISISPVSKKLLPRKANLLIQSLLTRSLYHKEIIQDLSSPDISNSSFEWLQILKYEIEISHDKRMRVQDRYGKMELFHGASNSALFGNLHVNQLNYSIPYGYEFHGPTPRMIMTPMTDRCLLNLTTAFKMRYTGMVFGPAQTGKTEAVYELSKCLGSHLVTFGCDAFVTLSKVLHFVCGAIQSGSMICLENVTRVPAPVLSILGQHLEGVRHALRFLEEKSFSEYQSRGFREKANIPEEVTATRKRGVTVISLHTLVVNNAGDFDLNSNKKEKTEESARVRRHSISEIVNIPDPRSTTSSSNVKHFAETRSEMSLKTKSTDLDETSPQRYRGPKSLGNIMFAGQLMNANPLFGCFMTVSSTSCYHPDIPDNLRNTMRSFSLVLPDYRWIAEGLLICHGFRNSSHLSRKIFAFMSMLEDQFFGDPVFTIGLGRLKSVISIAGNGYKLLQCKQPSGARNERSPPLSDYEKTEEYCIGQAIHTVTSSSINPLEYGSFLRLLKVSFPSCKDSLQESSPPDRLLLASVKEQLAADKLMATKELIDKVIQLNTTMHLNRSIILLGESGSGKTVCYQTLCRALCQFYSTWSQAVKKRRQQRESQTEKVKDENPAFSKVNLSTLFHKAMTNEELFGGICSTTKDWSDGLLSKLLRNTMRLQNLDADPTLPPVNDSIQYWFVFDGQLDNGLTAKLESLLDDRNELCLTNGERIKAPDSVRFVFETTNLHYASPAMISRSAVVNFESRLVDWKCLFFSWKKSAQNRFNISASGIKAVEEMLRHINEPLLEFLGKGDSVHSSPSLFRATESQFNAVSSIAEMSSILAMLTAVLDRFMSRESAEKALRAESVISDISVRCKSTPTANAETRFVSNAFAFAFVWAVAGRIHDAFYRKFDTFSRQLFATCRHSVIFPCSVFESVFDPTSGELVRFQDKSADIARSIPSQNYTVSTEIEKHFTVADLLVASGGHVLIAGEPGVGKSSFVTNLLSCKHKLQQIYISQGLTPNYFQRQIQRFVSENESRYRCNPLKPPPQSKGSGPSSSLVFIDDMSLAAVDNDFGNSHPTLEVLRQMISEGGVYDRERKYFQHLPHLQVIGACVPHGSYGKDKLNPAISPRLTRRMNVINMPALSDASLHSVYTGVYKAWLEEFPAYSLTHIEPFAKALAYATVDMYSKVKNNLVASPSCPHYIFSQHDLAGIAKGVFLYSPKSRLKPQSEVKSVFNKIRTEHESMPELTNVNQPILFDVSQSETTINPNSSSRNMEYTPASVSPLIRVIIRLWCHEVCRSFGDRIIDISDKQWFYSALQNTVTTSFCSDIGDKRFFKQGSGIISRESSTVEKKSSKARVKFKDIESSRQSDYRGPLISFKHLTGEDGELANILFSKHLFIASSRGVDGLGDHDKGYVECLEEHVEEGLRKSLQLMQSSEDKRLVLILYRQLLHQAVRISRVLTLPGGHALLVSRGGHGRANIVRLVAKLANIKVMNVNETALKCRNLFHSVIKDACLVAGLQGKPIVLFIPEGLYREGLEAVAAILSEGTCPGLYTPEELNAIANHLLPGGQVGQRRTENKTVAQERFLRRIRSNLHIVLCVWHGSLQAITQDFPTILSRAACVDIYREWTTKVLQEVAEKWLIEKGKNEFFYGVSWDLDTRDRQLSAIYSLMAKIHLDARSALDHGFKEAGLEVFSPLKFVEFVDLFRTVCNTICSEKQEELSRLRCATDKVEEGKKYIEGVGSRISEMTPLYEESQKELAESEASVKMSTKEYHESRDACDEQQKQIERLEIPLKQLKEEAHEEIGKLSPIYEAAMKALQSLDIHDVEEIRSYRKPPAGVKKVADILCVMFNKPANWDEAKLMLIRDNFFQELLFYYKDEVPENIYKKLKKYYDDSETTAESLLLISHAASSLSTWIRAVYEYCNTLRSLDPKKRELKEAEQNLNHAKALLGEKRVRCNQLKSALENNIKIYKDNMKKTRSLDKQIQMMKRAKGRAIGLLDSMNLYIQHWREKAEVLMKKIQTAPGDSLMIAATVCYLGTFEQRERYKLTRDWLQACRTGFDIGVNKNMVTIPVDDNFSPMEILSSDDEQTEWKRKGLPSDDASVLNCLMIRTCCIAAKKCWPILIDPHNQAGRMVRVMEECMKVPETLTESKSSVREKRPTRTLLRAILSQNIASYHKTITRPNTMGHQREATFHSETFKSSRAGTRLSLQSSTDERDFAPSPTPDTSDSAMSNKRSKTALSSISAITNESAFLQKFYVQAGLKDEPESPSASPLIPVAEDTLLVVNADCQGIDRKLKAAMASGVPVLVNHLERGIHGNLLMSVLSRKVSVSDDGQFYLSHGKRKLDYHPNFRLYLCASVPMEFNKDNKFVLPLHKSIVVNMEMSREGLTDQLVSLTISSERPELESQRKSLELDLYYLRQEKRQIQSRVLDMVIDLPGKLLDETSLPDIMADSRDQLNTTNERYEEGMNYKSEIDEKRVEYKKVACHAAELYSIVLQVCSLRTCYDMPLYFFVDIFKATLNQAKRAKTDSGSVAARAAELNDRFTVELYNRVCLNVFKEDTIFFPLLVICNNLLRDENISIEMYQAFLTLAASFGNHQNANEDENETETVISWLPKVVVERISFLVRFEEFKNLMESIRKQENQWKEYFDNSPNLLCSCPSGFDHLETFHRALLWIAVMPDKILSTIQNLILCELGPRFTQPVSHDLEKIFQISEPQTPVLVLLRNNNKPVTEDPALAIKCYAKSMKIPVTTICLGVSDQLTEAIRCIKDALKSKSWIVLQNCHFETCWLPDFLRLIEDQTSSEDPKSNSTNSGNSSHPSPKSRFRLWLIMKCTDSLTVPVTLSRKGLRVAWDETTWCTKRWLLSPFLNKISNDTRNTINNLSQLHYKALQEDDTDHCKRPYTGSTADLQFGIELIVNSLRVDDTRRAYAAQLFERMMCKSAVDRDDSWSSYRMNAGFDRELGIRKPTVLVIGKQDDSLQKESSSYIRTLQNGFEYLLQEQQRTQSDESSITIDSTVSLIPELRSICESLSRKSSHSSKALYQFFHREINYLRDVCWELSAKIEASSNTVKPKDQIPTENATLTSVNDSVQTWRAHPSYMNLNVNLEQAKSLLEFLRHCSNALVSYIRPRSRQPLGFDVSCIRHTKGFLASVLEDFCNENMADISSVSWECKVVSEKKDLLPPLSGVYLRNLVLVNCKWISVENLINVEKDTKIEVPILHLLPFIKGKRRLKSCNDSHEIRCPLVMYDGNEMTTVLTVCISSSVDQSSIVKNNVCITGAQAYFL